MARTARQMAALKRAQAASARKRRGTGKGRPRPQYGVGRDGKTKLTKAQIGKRPASRTSGRTVRKNARIDKKIGRTKSKAQRKIGKHAATVQGNLYTHSTQGGVYLNGRGVKAYKKGVKVNAKAQKRIGKLKKKKRR